MGNLNELWNPNEEESASKGSLTRCTKFNNIQDKCLI